MRAIVEKQKNTGMLLLLLVLLPILLLFFSSCGTVSYENYLKNTYRDIKWPNDMRLEYRLADTGWFGDGEIYAVFKFETEPIEFFAQFSYKNESDKSDKDSAPFSSEINVGFEERIKGFMERNDSDIPKNHVPDLNKAYTWKLYQGCLHMIYFPSDYSLILLEVRS